VAMEKILFVIASLALVSFAQAGPFGLKNGMTVDEIIEAGFKADNAKLVSIRGEVLSASERERISIHNQNPKKLDYDPVSLIYTANGLTNHKYPNMIFDFSLSKFAGLTELRVYTFGENKNTLSNASLKKLFQIYSEKLEKKYKTKPSKGVNKSKFNPITNIYRIDPPVNDVWQIWLRSNVRDILKYKNVDDRTIRRYVSIDYDFVASKLHYQNLKANLEKEQKEEIKGLIPKEEDL